jgi:hypothetical protein
MKKTKLVQSIAHHWTDEIFPAKNEDYGASYLLAGQTLALWFPKGVKLETDEQQIMYGLITRMLDKLIRTSLLTLGRGKVAKVEEEAAYQTLGDLGMYAFIAAGEVKDDE